MPLVIAPIAAGIALVLALPAYWFVVEAALAQLPRRPRTARRFLGRYVVIVPAHDEETGIGATLDSLARAVDERGSVLVVADNCSDRTADVARTHGVTVLERRDDSRRGKGYALAFAAESLADDPPDLLVFVDADCLVDPSAIGRLVDRCAESDGPVQADYLLVRDDPSPRAALGELAFLVRNRVRPHGLAAIAGPCGLFGTGMAMPYPLFRALPSAEGHLVEDMWLGIECALRGRAPQFVADAFVTSAAANGGAATTQSRRWEHGHLSVMRRDVPRLLASGDRRAFLLGLDLAIPPLALLVSIQLASVLAAGVVALVTGSLAALAIATSALTGVVIAVVASWARFGRERIPGRALLGVPRYVLSKLSIYLGFMNDRETDWVRTERAPREP